MAQRSKYEWRNPPGSAGGWRERLESLAARLLYPGALLTDAAKRAVYEDGQVGHATILRRPKRRRGVVGRGQGNFRFTVRVAGREPYEVKSRQSYAGWEWDLLYAAALVECRITDKHALLCAPEPGQGLRTGAVAEVLETGRRTMATVRESAPLGRTEPGSDDEYYILHLQLSAEGTTWSVRFAQRVPEGAEDLVGAGEQLQVAYTAIGDDEAVAVDWELTSGGEFS